MDKIGHQQETCWSGKDRTSARDLLEWIRSAREKPVPAIKVQTHLAAYRDSTFLETPVRTILQIYRTYIGHLWLKADLMNMKE